VAGRRFRPPVGVVTAPGGRGDVRRMATAAASWRCASSRGTDSGRLLLADPEGR
jgi:hypothetical protein